MEKISISCLLGPYQNAVDNALGKMRRANIAARIWSNDFNVWKPSPAEIINRLGWLHAPDETLNHLHHVRSILEPLTGDSLADVVLLGMGGSSLAADVFNRIFGSAPGFPSLHIVDTTDPTLIRKTAEKLNPARTLFLVSSKSGTTLEVVSLFNYFFNLAEEKLGETASEHFIFITDEGSPMLKQALDLQARYVFINNPNIGGRYSALSLPGIVPAAMIGMDIEKLLKNAADVSRQEKADFFSGGGDSAGVILGSAIGVLAQYGRDKLTLILPPRWASFGDWLEQLIAESTGKESKGILPVVSDLQPDGGVYGKDRVFVFFETPDSDWDSAVAGLASAGHPILKIKISDFYDLGGQMFLWEMATVVAAHLMSVNPFDQPDVEATKSHTRNCIRQVKENCSLPAEKPAVTLPDVDIYGQISEETLAGALTNFLSPPPPGAYAALLAYVTPSEPVDCALAALRTAIIQRFHLATTSAYGPRYLHSTGQLHKGDAGRGLFIVLTGENETDAAIPDAPGQPDSTLTFGQLLAAQAAGDLAALAEKGRRVIRFHLKADPAETLLHLARTLQNS